MLDDDQVISIIEPIPTTKKDMHNVLIRLTVKTPEGIKEMELPMEYEHFMAFHTSYATRGQRVRKHFGLKKGERIQETQRVYGPV